MPVRPQTFDSSGPEVRIRGNAYQVLEKYLALARDASAAGDRIAAENFYQHAEHYFRTINANSEGHHRPPMGQQQPHQGQPQQHPQQMQPPHNSQPHGMVAHEGQTAVAEPGSGPQPLTSPYPSNPSGDGQSR